MAIDHEMRSDAQYRFNRIVRRILFFVALGIFTIWVVFPFYWMVATSLRPNASCTPSR